MSDDRHAPREAGEDALTNPAYDPGNPELRPECVYLYYLPDPTDFPHAEVYFHDWGEGVGLDQVESAVKELVFLIQNDRLKPCAWSFGELMWRRRSYFVLAIRSDDHILVPRDAVTFTFERGDGNHNFRDGRDIPAFDTKDGRVSAMACINHMKNEAGGPLGRHESERFRIIMSTEPPIKFLHDDTGTNMGPPVGSP